MQKAWEEKVNGTFFTFDVCTCTSLFFMLTTSPSIQARVGSSTQTWEPTMMLTGVPCETNGEIIKVMSRKNRNNLMTKALLDHHFLSLIYYVCEFNTFCWIDVFHEMSVWCCDLNNERNSILTAQWVRLWTLWIYCIHHQASKPRSWDLDQRWNQLCLKALLTGE